MNIILLIIKSGVNSTVYKSNHVVDRFLKPYREKYYLSFYILFSVLYCFISFSSIGIASENPILLSFGNYIQKIINPSQYVVVLILQTLFWKIMIGSSLSVEQGHYNVLNLYYPNKNDKLKIIEKMIFFNNSSFRLVISSLIIIPIAIPFYFTNFILINIFIAYFLLFGVILFLNSLETLLYFLEQNLKINTSISTITIFVFGYISLTYFSTLKESNITTIMFLFFLIIFFKFGIDYYIKKKWL